MIALQEVAFYFFSGFSLQDMAPKFAGSISKTGVWFEMAICGKRSKTNK
jgi:hypothetical protein